MESVGEFFRQVRETKGLTVDEVASKTRIRADFVKALEEGNFAKLPDQVFARGFVRSYARSLGLDEEDAIHRFAQSAGAFYEKQGERERLRQRQVEEERRRKANRKAVGIAIAVAIVTLVFLLSREQTSTFVRRAATDAPPLGKKSAPFAREPQEPAARPESDIPLPPPLGGNRLSRPMRVRQSRCNRFRKRWRLPLRLLPQSLRCRRGSLRLRPLHRRDPMAPSQGCLSTVRSAQTDHWSSIWMRRS